MQNELFWLTDLTLGDGKYTEIKVYSKDKNLECVFVTTGTYEIIDAKNESINDRKSTKIKDLKGYTKIYIMNPDITKMKYSGGDEWMATDPSYDPFLIKIKDNKMYKHSLFTEGGEYYSSSPDGLNDESAKIYEKK